MMCVLSCLLLLLGGMSSEGWSGAEDFRGLGDVLTEQRTDFSDVQQKHGGALVEQQTQREATVDGLGTDFSEQQQQKHGALMASTTAQRLHEAHRQSETAEKLVLSARGRRLAPAGVSTQRRGLSSSDTCADPSGPQLQVEGVGSFTKDVLIGSRSVLEHLDKKLDESLSNLTQNVSALWSVVKDALGIGGFGESDGDKITATTAPMITVAATTIAPGPFVCSFSADACRGEVIRDYYGTVNCTGASACAGATFVNVNTVICGGDGADTCSDVRFVDVANVLCVGNGENTCYRADITRAETVECSGTGSRNCYGAVVTTAETVECSGAGDFNCRNVAITNAVTVECRGSAAFNCYLAAITNVETVQCSGDGDYNCRNAAITNGTVVECSGGGLSGCGSLSISNANNDYSGYSCASHTSCTLVTCGAVSCAPVGADTFDCSVSGDGCKGEVIRNHDGVVNCTGSTACEDATFVNVTTVRCDGAGAKTCLNARFINVQNVLCVGSGSENCYGAVITNASIVECSGKGCQYVEITNVSTVKCKSNGNCYAITVSNADTVECGPLACQYSTITSTGTLECGSTSACLDADITNVAVVMCSGGSACRDSTISGADAVTCSGSGSNVCIYAVINAEVVACGGSGHQICYDTTFSNAAVVTCTNTNTHNGGQSCKYMSLQNDNGDYSGFSCSSPSKCAGSTCGGVACCGSGFSCR